MGGGRDGHGLDRFRITRRDLLLSIPAVAAVRRVGAQAARPALHVRALNHLTLSASDPKRSIAFYQGLFGMPIQARQGQTTLLRIGSGPQFLAIGGAGASAKPGITHFCVTVDGFDVDRILATLEQHGVTRAEAGGGGLSGGPMKVRVRRRGPDAGGAKDGTPEIYVGDPEGIVVQLQDPSYCGGAGALGEVCASVEPSPGNGLIALRDLSHFTMFVNDAQRSNDFYRSLFGLSIRSYQGPTSPTLAIGPGVQFIMFAGGRPPAAATASAPPPRPASINHVCFNLDGFDKDRILKTLDDYGIKPRENAQGPVPPLRSYVSMRMENRGGAKEGTPELYFTDPDGILVQLQDASYCGGAGVLGNVCPPITSSAGRAASAR